MSLRTMFLKLELRVLIRLQAVQLTQVCWNEAMYLEESFCLMEVFLLLLTKICDSRIHGPPVHSSAWHVGGAQQIIVGGIHAHLFHVGSESSLHWKCQLSFSNYIFRLYFSHWVILLQWMKDDFENQKKRKRGLRHFEKYKYMYF